MVVAETRLTRERAYRDVVDAVLHGNVERRPTRGPRRVFVWVEQASQQVSQVLALAYQEGVPVAGRGSGTGLSGGAITPPGGIQVVFTRMNQILEMDTENLTATVEPGVINLDLDTHARKLGLRYARDGQLSPEDQRYGRRLHRQIGE